MSSVSDILKQLESLNIENSLQAFIPSLQKTHTFKPLNLKQQKELLKTTIDESLIRLAFNNLLFDIIQENSLDDININTLYPFDRTAIALVFRAKGLDQNFTINDKVVSLDKKLEEIKEIKATPDILSSKIVDGQITVDVAVPTLGIDREINNFTLNKTKSKQETDLKSIISDLIVYEFSKFIVSLTFNIDDKSETTNFSTLSPGERITVVETLPSTITSKIFDFVKSYRAFENKFTQVSDESIDIDGNFFTI